MLSSLSPLSIQRGIGAVFLILGPVDKLDSQARQNLIQDSFCGVYLGAFADGGCRVGVL